MKTKRLKSFLRGILYSLLLIPTQATHAQWVSKKDIPVVGAAGGRWSPMSFTINNKIYVGGGYSNNMWYKDLQEFDPATNKWTAKSELPGGYANRSAGIAFVINGKAYLGLGAENHLSFTTTPVKLKDLWEYNPSTDKWTKKKDLPDSGRSDASVIVLNNKAYIVGGQTYYLGTATCDVWEYDPAGDKWTEKSQYNGYGELYGAAAFSINNKGYITGGQNLYNHGTYEYDAVNDKWTKKADFPDSARLGAVAFTYNGKGYVALGNRKSGYQKSIFYYNPQNDTWTYLTSSFPTDARSYGIAQVVNDKVYMGAGWKLDGSQQFYYLDWLEGNLQGLLGIAEMQPENKATVYPNPASTDLYFRVENGRGCDYALYNLTGQLVLKGRIGHNMFLDIRDIPGGQYIIELSVNEQTSRQLINIIH